MAKTKIKDIGKTGKVVYAAVSSNGKDVYDIRQSRDGSYSCECIGFTMRRTCRHLTEFLDRQIAHREGR